MFRFPNLKLYRKFLILAVMLTGIFILSSTRHVAAETCCEDCIATLQSCHAYCLSGEVAPGDRVHCVQGCFADFAVCSDLCGVPVCTET
jgi:hypothetical protein